MSASITLPSMGVDTGKPVARSYEQRPAYEGAYTVTPTEQTQILETEHLRMTGDITVEPIPEEYIIPSGTLNITENGTHDVTAYESASVDVPIPPGYIVPSGTVEISSNGTVDVTQYASADVSVASAVLQDKSVAPSETAQTIEPDEGYDGLRQVSVGAIPSDYVGSEIERRSSDDLTASGGTVSVPKGYYTENASKEITNASAAGASSLTVNPVLTVDYDDGTITATNSASASVSPIASAGYAAQSLSHGVNVSGNTATQLMTIPATTYAPSGSAQIIPSGRLLTGDQTISAIGPPFYDMSGAMSFLGAGVELVDGSLYTKTDNLKNTSFNTWTPSTTSTNIVASVSAKTISCDIGSYDYFIVWECGCDPVYTGSPTLKAHFLLSRCYMVQAVIKRPSSWANIQSDTFNGNACVSIYTSNFLRYYGTTTGTVTYTWSQSYGIYFTATAATFASTTNNVTNVTYKTPVVAARCSTTYMSTANCGLMDKEKSTWFIRGKLYRAKPSTIFHGIYEKVVDIVNE